MGMEHRGHETEVERCGSRVHVAFAWSAPSENDGAQLLVAGKLGRHRFKGIAHVHCTGRDGRD